MTDPGCATFRYDIGERVAVWTHPARPAGEVTDRWAGAEIGDPYGQDAYAVSGFVTRQREASLVAEGFRPLPVDARDGWRMTGSGEFRVVAPGVVESDGGPGILWYAAEEFGDALLVVDWRLASPDDNSGVFVRMPPLAGDDLTPATERGWEVQIDDRGVDHERGVTGSALHRTGAIYGRAPGDFPVSRPPGCWNRFEIETRGASIVVRQNGVVVSALTDERAPRRGHLGLQAHHPGSRVRFRGFQVRLLSPG